jgi:hypothetical protein
MRNRFISTLAIAFAVSGLTVAAQDRTSNGNTTGTAVPRGGDGGGSGTAAPRGGDSGGSSSSSGSSGGSTSSSSGSGSMGSAPTPTTWSTFEAPRRSNEQSQGRTRSAGSSSSGERAAPRGGSSETRGNGSTASSSGSGSSAEAPSRGGVPTYSRPREGRPATGVAVERGTVRPPTGGGGNIIYYPYNPWGFWGPGYGYGLGYLFYDPWYGGGYGYGSPYDYGYGGYGYGGYGYGGGGGGGGYQVSQSYKDTGNLRLKIDPKLAQVFVDGYYVGIVDSFDGAFQKLGLDSGGHKIDLKAEGFEPLQFDVLITPGETVTYKGEMKPIR